MLSKSDNPRGPKPDTKRTDKIVRLYEKGDALAEIGKKFGISRQRVWQIVKFSKNGNYEKKDQRFLIPGDCINSRPSETYVLGKLSRMGVKAKAMPYNHWFDLDVNGLAVEIKSRTKPTKRYDDSKLLEWKFSNTSSKMRPDFYIFVCGNLNKRSTCYVVPGNKVGVSFSIPVNPHYERVKRKYEKYKENWSVFAPLTKV